MVPNGIVQDRPTLSTADFNPRVQGSSPWRRMMATCLLAVRPQPGQAWSRCPAGRLSIAAASACWSQRCSAVRRPSAAGRAEPVDVRAEPDEGQKIGRTIHIAQEPAPFDHEPVPGDTCPATERLPGQLSSRPRTIGGRSGCIGPRRWSGLDGHDDAGVDRAARRWRSRRRIVRIRYLLRRVAVVGER